MTALLTSLAEGFNGSAARRAELDAALAAGLPAARNEAWKYTPLKALERRSFQPAPGVASLADHGLIAHIPAPRLVLVDGRFDPAASDLAGLEAGVSVQALSQLLANGDDQARFLGRRYDKAEEIFARLNGALADEGVVVRLEENARAEAPLHLVFIAQAGQAELAWHLRHFIELRAGARLQLVEHHLQQGTARHLVNSVAHVHLAAGATLEHARVQAQDDGLTSVLRTDAVLARDARYHRVDLELGAALSRHELNARLEGNNARLSANGVLLGSGRRHIDTRLGIEHIARDTACELLWRGVGAERSKVVFHGGINIRAGADGTNANLSNKNLLLSANAEIDTQPVLVIDADEVQAAHGATVGQIDQNALFYLRSRGIPAATAQAMLSAAFCSEPLAAVNEQLRAALAGYLRSALEKAGMA